MGGAFNIRKYRKSKAWYTNARLDCTVQFTYGSCSTCGKSIFHGCEANTCWTIPSLCTQRTLTSPYWKNVKTLPYVLPYLTLYVTLSVTLPYMLSYLTSYLTLRLTLPYLTSYLILLNLTLPYLTLPYHTIHYVLPHLILHKVR